MDVPEAFIGLHKKLLQRRQFHVNRDSYDDRIIAATLTHVCNSLGQVLNEMWMSHAAQEPRSDRRKRQANGEVGSG